jgi:hypothetical protein
MATQLTINDPALPKVTRKVTFLGRSICRKTNGRP